jgi:hypothetical protein
MGLGNRNRPLARRKPIVVASLEKQPSNLGLLIHMAIILAYYMWCTTITTRIRLDHILNCSFDNGICPLVQHESNCQTLAQPDVQYGAFCTDDMCFRNIERKSTGLWLVCGRVLLLDEQPNKSNTICFDEWGVSM